ncbi:hypothetical protein HN51_069679, partial [Arachis hypogaea]
MRPLSPSLRHRPTAVAEAMMPSLCQKGEAVFECSILGAALKEKKSGVAMHRLRLG